MVSRLVCWNQQPMQLLHHSQNYSTAPLHVAVLQPAGRLLLWFPYLKYLEPVLHQTTDLFHCSLSCMSKVLNRHFHLLISEHLSIHYPLANSQWGFQPKKSTVSALLQTTHEWLTHLESGSEIGAIFFDFKMAFDTVLICPAIQTGGLDPQIIITWIHNYLAEWQQVVINGMSSCSSYVLSGVPQGSILGPLLFFIYINDNWYKHFYGK